MTNNYVIGFVHCPETQTILLMQKSKPEWLKGKWNGVGGKVEGLEHLHSAMAREVLEETGLIVPVYRQDLFLKINYRNKDWESRLYFFDIKIDNTTLRGAKTMEEEPVQLFTYDAALNGYGRAIHDAHVLEDPRLVQNLYWIIPYLLNPSRRGMAECFADDSPAGWASYDELQGQADLNP